MIVELVGGIKGREYSNPAMAMDRVMNLNVEEELTFRTDSSITLRGLVIRVNQGPDSARYRQLIDEEDLTYNVRRIK